jgi:hypothetical protein
VLVGASAAACAAMTPAKISVDAIRISDFM